MIRRYLPPQHGAWAMLLVPYLAGVLVAGFRWPDVPLLGAWLAGYLFSYFALQAAKTGRFRRFRPQLLLYGTATALLATPVLLAAPRVLRLAPAYAALIAVNLWHARRRRDRALVNDLASVLMSCLLVFVVATVAGAPLADAVPAFVVLLLYFAGTVLYVKTMIRERGNAAYLRASIAFHALAVAAAVPFGPGPVVVFALLLLRAVLVPRHRLTPKQVGVPEIGAGLLVLAAATLA